MFSEFTPASDVYMFALLVWHCCWGGAKVIWQGLDADEIMRGHLQKSLALPPFPQKCDPKLVAVTQRCFSHKPADRPRMNEVIQALYACGVDAEEP